MAMIGPEFGYALLAGILPSLIWLFFWTREDNDQPEPRSMLAGCFFGGAFVVILAIPLEQYMQTIAGGNVVLQYGFWSAIEEVLKFTALALIVLRTRWYDEPVDAMIYAIAVALGFAALENTLFIMGPLSDGKLAEGLLTGNMRFIGATLVHVVSSALVGYALAITFYRGVLAKIFGWVLGLGAAIAVHAWFNIAIVSGATDDTLKIFSWVWGAVVVLIVLFEEAKVVRPKLV